MLVRYRATAGKGFSSIAVAAVFVASMALAQEGAKQSSSMQELPPESSAFYARVATFFGMDPKVIQGLVPELRQEKVNTRDAVLLIIFAHKRTLPLLRGEKISKEEVEKVFRDNISDLLQERRRRADWRTVICDELGVDLYAMIKQASNSVSEAMRPPSDAARSVRPVSAATPKEVPEDLYQPLMQHLRMRPEALKVAWGALEPIEQRTPRAAVILLVLAREKANRLLEYGTVAPAEKEKVFVDALADFIGQVESRPRVGWGILASQVGLHSVDLERETSSILSAAAERQQQRKKLSGAKVEELAVPRELSEW
jgi:hypothetical protein